MDDGKEILAMCDKYGVDPHDFIRVGTMRYLDNIRKNHEAPPGCGLCEWRKKEKGEA